MDKSKAVQIDPGIDELCKRSNKAPFPAARQSHCSMYRGYTSPATSSPTSDVDSPIWPADSDLILPLSSAFTIAPSTRAAASASPSYSSIICAAPIAASG